MMKDRYSSGYSDPAPEAEWQVWYQDMFDRECPRQVEVSGHGLTAGLIELWARHLFETVGADGREGFSRFDLWWQQPGKSIKVSGSWGGMVRLREWVFGNKRQAQKGYVGDGDQQLLIRLARVHSYLVVADKTSQEILAAAERSARREDFEMQLTRLEQEVLKKDD